MSELRRDPTTGRTVIIAPERLAGTRLWSPRPAAPASDGPCPFCEGNEAMAGREILAWRPPGQAANGPGWSVRVVPNRLPALRVESQYAEPAPGLFQVAGGLGAHEVIIETPRHDATWSTMSAGELRLVLWAWRERMRDLRRDVRLRTFLVGKSVGRSAGAMLDHPHSQLLALPFVPQHLDDELTASAARFRMLSRCAYCALIEAELAAGTRVVSSDETTVAISAFAARVPFETWILPRRHLAAFDDECDECLVAIAERLHDTIRRLDAALLQPPHSVVLHMAPVGEAARSYHWHLKLIPRMVAVNALAFDGGLHTNPVTPEAATEALREAGG